MDIKKTLENLIFYGTVCALTPQAGTVRVCREEKGNKVTNDLFVLQRGSSESKDYWMPAIGDQVLCVQMPNFSGSGVGDGFVLGTFFSSTDAPPGGADASTRVIDTPGNLANQCRRWRCRRQWHFPGVTRSRWRNVRRQ